MSSAITVLTTEDSQEKASKVAEASRALDAASVATETVQSYYWWEGKVQFDPEWRVSVTTTAPFDAAKKAIEAAHSYDLPMIIYDLEAAPDDHGYWKGLVDCSDEAAAVAVAKALVERRVVACAQATPQGGLAVKTVLPCKAKVEEVAPSVKWSPIGGNEGYLKWLEEECAAAKA